MIYILFQIDLLNFIHFYLTILVCYVFIYVLNHLLKLFNFSMFNFSMYNFKMFFKKKSSIYLMI